MRCYDCSRQLFDFNRFLAEHPNTLDTLTRRGTAQRQCRAATEFEMCSGTVENECLSTRCANAVNCGCANAVTPISCNCGVATSNIGCMRGARCANAVNCGCANAVTPINCNCGVATSNVGCMRGARCANAINCGCANAVTPINCNCGVATSNIGCVRGARCENATNCGCASIVNPVSYNCSVVAENDISSFTASVAEFFALMPQDNLAPVAPSNDVDFPHNGACSGTAIARISANSFNLAETGTYQIMFVVSITEAGQLMLTLNGGDLLYTVAGKTTCGAQITGMAIVTTTAKNSVLTVRNPAGNPTALTVTPLAGGTRQTSAHLVITKIA